ncbi:MAG: response regulator [Limisphaerales bacterium]
MNRKKSFTTRVAIADDHQLVCAAVADILRSDQRLVVAAQVHNGPDALALAKRDDIDVLLLDLELPGVHGLEVLEGLGGRLPTCILSHHTEPHFVSECIRSGALGYASKDIAPNELLQAVLDVARGETYFSSDVQKIALSFTVKAREKGLTEREREVLQLSASGMKSADIAARLGISRRTAEAHRSNFSKKLSLKNQTEIVRYALRVGIIEAPLPVPPGRASA